MEGRNLLRPPQPNLFNPRPILNPNNNPHNPHPTRPPQRPYHNPNRRVRHPPFPQCPSLRAKVLHRKLPIKPAHRIARHLSLR
ncbi:hypothetical protein EMPG_13420 [Blastomyces silverae]|uniref:Uncharacterized protein n=1 Tax=Blastomyces silverae TaxID=2060906 RepID=A0A0H1BJX8_9EURO|nr:hypothetical protein EMPG_13420 [Blastomyces silverae]